MQFTLPVAMHSDPRFLGLSPQSLALWTLAASWSATHGTAGHIPAAVLPMLHGATEDDAQALVDAELWQSTPDGFAFCDWPAEDTEDPDRGALQRRREADRLRKRKSRRVRAERAAEAAHVEESRAVTDHPVTRHVTPSLSPPHPPYLSPKRTPYGGSARPAKTEINFEAYLGNSDSEKTKASKDQEEPDMSEPSASAVVAAWCEAYEAMTGGKPPETLKKQVGRDAKSLLASHTPSLVLDAATEAGRKGFPTVGREIGPLAAKRTRSEPRRDPNTLQAVEW